MTDQANVVQLLEASLQSDNETRKSAEAQLHAASKNDPELFMTTLLDIFAGDRFTPDDRSMAMIHYKVVLKDYFMRRSDNVWAKLSPQHKSHAKQQLVRIMISPDTQASVRRATIPLIGDMAGVLLDESEGESWEELVPAVIRSLDSPAAIPSVVALLAEIVPYIVAQVSSEAEGFSKVVGGLLGGQQSMEVRAEALKLLCVIACETAECRACWPLFQPMIPLVMTFMEKCSQGCLLDDAGAWKQYNENDEEYDDAVQYCVDIIEAVIDVADRASAFFKPHINAVFDSLFAIVRNTDIDEDLRKFSGEIILSILSDKPKMCKDVPGFNNTMIETSILLMLTVTEEDLNDMDDVRNEPLFSLGERGVDHIVKAMGGQEMFPILFGYVKTLIQSPQWEKRYAGISCICQTTEYIPILDRELTLADLMPVVVRALQDDCWMVRLAACRCVGQMAYDLPPVFQVHHTEEVLQNLIFRFDDDHPEVVHKALRAYTNFTDELTAADIEPYMTDLLKRFHRLVTIPFSDPKKIKDFAAVRENAITAISVTASVAQQKFTPFYKDIAPLIMQILQTFDENDEHVDYLRDVRAQAVDCISHIGLAVAKDDVFQEDGVHVMKILIELRKSNIRDDDPVSEYLYEAFKRMVYAMKDRFSQFIEPLMEYYIVVLQSRGESVNDYTDVPNYLDYSFQADNDGFQAIKTSVIIEIIQALSLINTMIDQCGESFIPVLKPTIEVVIQLVKYQLVHEAVAGVLQVMASALKLMNSMVEKHQIPKSEVTTLLEVIVSDSFNLLGDDEYITNLIENASFLCTVADGVAGCLLNAGTETLPDGLIDMVAKKTFSILAISTEERNRHLQILQEPGIDDEDVGKIMEQAQLQQGFRSSLLSLLGGTMSSHPEAYMRISATMTVEFLDNCLKSQQEQDLCLGIFLCDDILQYLGEAGHSIWPHFINSQIEAVSSPNASIRQAAAYGIVWAGRQAAFTESHVKSVVPHLARCISMNDVNDDEIQLATDNAVAAVNVLLLHKGDFLTKEDSTELSFQLFKNYPLVVDTKENVAMTDLIFKGLNENNPHLVGFEQQNLPTIIGCFGKMYKTLLSEDDIDKKIAEFMKSLGEATLKEQMSKIATEHQKYVERMMKDL
eukprot:GHVH01004044.1.p1 GENE.GHVH01004044.1~~GHVH01004044.1.p1  ORF type:complete len:1147 (+),score=259.93 GHVH01004044.1:50-3442(+)